MSHALPSRSEATTYSVEDLLRMANDGVLRVPSFQRRLRWKRKHNIELFDSICRGFPTGTLLLWDQPGPSETLTYGKIQVSAPVADHALYVVDGQQRLTALVGALMHPDREPRGGAHALWYDTRDQVVLHRSSVHQQDSWVPLNVLSDSTKTMEWAFNWPLREDKELQRRLFQVAKAIREYRFPAYVVHTDDEREVRLIYTRANRTGVEMTEPEVFAALARSGDDKPLIALQGRLKSLGFGKVNDELLLRCHKMISGAAMGAHVHTAELAQTASLDDTEHAVRRSIEFLQSLGIPHQAMLPSFLPLLVLSCLHHHHALNTEGSRRRLAMWVWRGWFNRQHLNSSNSTLEGLRNDCQRANIDLAISALHDRLDDSECPPQPASWSSKSVLTRLYALSMLDRRQRCDKPLPKSLLHDTLNKGLIHLFPKLPGVDADLISARYCGPSSVGLVLRESAHAISAAAEIALEQGDITTFLRLRNQDLHAEMARFHERCAAPNERSDSIAGILARTG